MKTFSMLCLKNKDQNTKTLNYCSFLLYFAWNGSLAGSIKSWSVKNGLWILNGGLWPAQYLFEKVEQTPWRTLAQEVIAYQFFLLKSNNVQPPLWGYEGPQIGVILTIPGDLQSLRGVVKRCWNSMKIGRHSPFGPRSPVEFVPVFQKSFG